MIVRWRRRAILDLRRIHQHIAAQDTPQTAESVTARIETSADQLELFPRLGRRATLPRDIRRLVVSGLPYVIYYRIIAHEAEILHVRDARRQPPQAAELPR